MPALRHFLPVILLPPLLLAAANAEQPADRIKATEATALDRYVAEPDPTFAWKKIKSLAVPGGTMDVIELTSQTWLSEKEVNKPVWKHWLNIVRPDKVEHKTGLLIISGGANDKAPPDKVDMNALMLATATKSVVTELKGVPSQPLTYAGTNVGVTEDNLIAYSWDKYLHTGDEKWPARLPMTKAAVRAMDAITAFCASAEGGKIPVEKFFVTGASKRGWTTWTTAAVDPRVVAIAPIVIDVLNLGPSLVHHWETYGFWAPAIKEYSDIGLQNWHGTPEYAKLLKIEDPWEYRQRLTIPKFIINSAGDQFFPPDSSRFYFDGLPGQKFLRYVPNTDHSLKKSDAWMTLLACYEGILHQSDLPSFKWTTMADGSLDVDCKTAPTKALLWSATNETARDFRLESFGAKWTSSELAAAAATPGKYTATVTKPKAGWTAWFVELTFPSGRTSPWKFTTSVQMNPDTFAHKFSPPKK